MAAPGADVRDQQGENFGAASGASAITEERLGFVKGGAPLLHVLAYRRSRGALVLAPRPLGPG